MRASQLVPVVLLSLSSSTAGATNAADSDSSLHFHSNNATESALYHWVGSYFHGTSWVELTPFTGLLANDHFGLNISGCPRLQGETFSTEFDTILAVTERGKYNLGDNPVNAYLTFWPSNTNFTSLSPNGGIADMPTTWSLFSSDPMYYFNGFLYVKDNFNFTLAQTNKAPYNVTSTLDNYYGEGSIPINMTRCNADDTITWDTNLISQTWWRNVGYNYSYPDPVLDIRFDGQSANLTLTGYFDATPAPVGKNTFDTTDIEAQGQIKISFSGVIDTYHSDELVRDSATPTWLRTVHLQNRTMDEYESSAASEKDVAGAWVLALVSFVGLSTVLT